MFLNKQSGVRHMLAYFMCLGLLLGMFGPIIAHAGMEDINLRVTGLLTNGVENPAAIDNENPWFSWKLKSGKRDTYQYAYQVIVIQKLSPNKMVWDSGKVVSDKSSGVPYGGTELSADTPYLWKVRVWTNHGDVSNYSKVNHFRIGLSKSDWVADYIWDYTEKPNDFVYFRKTFSLDKVIEDATVYVSAHNDYQLYLNGQKLGVGPARSDPYSYGQYCAYNITDLLQSGVNAFAALAHWHGVWSNSGTNAKPAFILEARIRYTDGSVETIKTDGSWKLNGTTPYIEENPIYFGHYGGAKNRASINYDARREIAGWIETGFDNRSWSTAKVVNRTDYNLYAQLISEQIEMEWEVPVSVVKKADRWLVDFGKCLSGWPEIKLHQNAAGDQIKVQYWEVEKGWGDAGYDTYTAKSGEEVFYAPFVRHTSFRTLEISGYKGELTADDVRGIMTYSYANKTGSFECSDQRLNNVYTMSERSGRQNIQQGIISVDANREQSPWTADSWNIGIGFLYNHKNTMVIDKVIKDYAGEQRESGNFLCCSPARDYPSEMAEWSLYWPMMLWEQYLFVGSDRLLIDYYPNLTKFLNFIERSKNPGTGLYNPGGWRQSDYAGGSIDHGGDNIVTNCHIYRNYEIAAKIAALTGNQDDAAQFSGLAMTLKNNINRCLLKDGKAYKTTPGSAQIHPLGTAWALRFDIVPDSFRNRVINWMAGQKEAYYVGGYGGDALYNGLYSAGLGYIATKDFSRYDQMLNSNNTNWESFGELSIDNMGNHAWTAYPSYILQKYVGGVSPTSGGFTTFDIMPVTGGLEYARSTVPTAKGEVETAWEKIDKDNINLSVTVPANTTAQIYVPDNDMKDVTVSESDQVVFKDGAYIRGTDGIHTGRRLPGYILFEVGSGTYEFHVSGTPLNTPEPGVKPKTDFIIDDTQAFFGGAWFNDNVSEVGQRYGDSFRYYGGAEVASVSAEYSAVIEKDGLYNIYGWWTSNENRAKNTPYTIIRGEDQTTVRVNQEENGGKWNLLHTMTLKAGDTVTVKITNDADEYVIADAVCIVFNDGVVIDDNEATYEGHWIHETASSQHDRYGNGFRYADPVSGEPTAAAIYETTVTEAGRYSVFCWWSVHANRAQNTPYTIICAGQATTVRVNQEANGGMWNLLHIVTAQAGDTITVKITNDADEYVIADAVKIAPYGEEDEDDPLTPFQELQLFLYSVYLPETETCSDPAYVAAFEKTLEEAEALCTRQDPDDAAAVDIMERLQNAIKDVLDHQKVNLALGRPVTASEEMPVGNQWSKDFITDGIKARDNSKAIGYTTWEYTLKDLSKPIDLTIDLGSQKALNQVVLYPRLGTVSHNGGTANFPENYEIQVSTDGNNFKTVKKVTGQPDSAFKRVICRFPRETARYLRIHVTGLGEYAGDEGGLQTPYRLQLSEVEVYNETEYYTIKLEFDENRGTVTGELVNIEDNTETILTAVPNDGWQFGGWYRGNVLISMEPAYTFRVISDMTIEARFYKPASKSTLETVIQEADYIDIGGYTSESVMAFTEAKAAARVVIDNPEATQQQVDYAVKALQEAIDGLIKSPEDINRFALKGLLTKAGYIDTVGYTSESIRAFTETKEVAKAVLDNPEATQQQVDDAVKALQEAFDGLIELPEELDRSALEVLLTKAGYIDTVGYTSESVRDFTEAKATAKVVFDDPEATQKQVDYAINTLEKAIAGLVKADASSDQQNGVGNPQTGDSFSVIVLGIVLLSGLIVLLTQRKITT